MKISEIRPFGKKIDIVAKVVSLGEIREVTSKLDNQPHKVTEVLVADDSGAILVTLWDEAIEKVSEGKSYKFDNCYSSTFKNSLRLNIGRFGTFEETDDIADVNTENNVSEKEIN